MTWRVRDVLAIAALLGAVATVIVALDANINLAFEAPELRTALETSQALIAVACAYLVFGRVKRAHSMNDLAVVFALGLLGASNVFFAALPSRGLEGRLIFQTWAPMTLRLIATAAIAWAALARERQVPARIQRPGLTAVMATDVVLAVVAIGVALLRSTLPRGVTVGMSHPGNPPDLHGHSVLLGGFLLMSVLLGAASYGFLKRSERRRDSLIGALSIACAVQTFSYLCFALYPSINTEIIQIGDLLRLGFYFVLLFGGEREIDRYWTRLADIAIYEERRRLARDLHDGVAQELAYVVSQTRLLQRGTAPPDANQSIAAAAERALDESRRAITALTMRDDEPLHLAIARAAEDVAGRVDVDIVCEIEPRAVSTALREGLVRIVQEAVSNAGRHGHAQRVTITLDSDDVLRIVDDGSGFDTSEAVEGRYGLVSMRERSEQIGGRFRIESTPGIGTTVEIELP